jgi:hypothetical protein
MYGFETTDDIQLDKVGLPIGTYKAMIVSEEPYAKEGKQLGVVAEFEAVEGINKGQKGKVWFLTTHPNEMTANIARQRIKRIADATGSAVSSSAPLKGRVLTIEVVKQKNNPDYTEVKRFLPENYQAETNDEPPM